MIKKFGEDIVDTLPASTDILEGFHPLSLIYKGTHTPQPTIHEFTSHLSADICDKITALLEEKYGEGIQIEFIPAIIKVRV